MHLGLGGGGSFVGCAYFGVCAIISEPMHFLVLWRGSYDVRYFFARDHGAPSLFRACRALPSSY